MWLRELVNSGVPVSTSRAIDRMVVAALKRARVQPSDHCARMDQVHAFQAQGHGKCDRDDGLIYPLDCGVALMSREIGLGSKSSVTYGIGDTGATDHLHDSTQNPMLYDTVPWEPSIPPKRCSAQNGQDRAASRFWDRWARGMGTWAICECKYPAQVQLPTSVRVCATAWYQTAGEAGGP